jgi:hypothetical protein
MAGQSEPSAGGVETDRFRAHISGMSEPKKEDIDKQGGWLVRVKTPPSLERLFYVYEMDWAKARDLVTTKVPVDSNETIEAVGPANIHALTGNRMKPGDVLQFE